MFMKLVIRRRRTPEGNIKFNINYNTVYADVDDGVDVQDVKKCIKDNLKWFTDRIHESKPTEALECDSRLAQFFSGKKTFICGELLDVLPYSDKKSALLDNVLYINEKKFADKTERIAEIKRFILRLAREFLSKEISSVGTRMALCPSKIVIKALKQDQWLLCGNKTNPTVCIDYRAIQLPSHLRRYIIVHSFAHFYESVHNYRFWQIVRQYTSDYTKCLNDLANFSYIKEI